LQDADTINQIFKNSDAFTVDYLRKPFEPIELICRVKNLINLKHKNDELIEYNVELTDTMTKLNKTVNERNFLLTQLITQKDDIEKKFKDLSRQIDIVRDLVPKIASNDLPILKFVIKTIEDSSDIIDKIVKEGGENEDSFRIITKTVEPLKTAQSNIESIINFFIFLGIIDKELIINDDLTKTHFYSVMNDLYKLGKISQDRFKEFLYDFKFKTEEKQVDIELF
jgi:polyhydroxyalkanoate synthesis regulator phasin